MQDNCQKIKLLKLYELLCQETDEENPLTTADIIDRLEAMGISCERRTLAKDIDVLNEQGYEVLSRRVGKEKGYYVLDRSFSVPELKILIDAVQASSFITEKKTDELIKKIAELGGSHRASIFSRNMISFNTRKHSNELIYYSVDSLEDALYQKKKASFRYFDLDEHGKKNYRKDGGAYIVEPVGLVFHEDNYYLVAYSAKHGKTANYRVDRMDSVTMLDELVGSEALAQRDALGIFTNEAFKMYGGEPTTVKLGFKNHLIGSVYDKFGEKVKMSRINSETCVATVRVQVSPTFWGWIFQFGRDMHIVSPESMRRQYFERAKELLDNSSVNN